MKKRNLFLTVLEAGKSKVEGPTSGEGFLVSLSHGRRRKDERMKAFILERLGRSRRVKNGRGPNPLPPLTDPLLCARS
jgi:hypothetical protein